MLLLPGDKYFWTYIYVACSSEAALHESGPGPGSISGYLQGYQGYQGYL